MKPLILLLAIGFTASAAVTAGPLDDRQLQAEPPQFAEARSNAAGPVVLERDSARNIPAVTVPKPVK